MIQLDCGAFYGATLSCFPLFSPRVGLPSHTISYKYRPFLFTSPFYTMKNPVILFMALIDACCLTSCDRRVRVSFPFLFPPQCLQISPWEKEISRIMLVMLLRLPVFSVHVLMSHLSYLSLFNTSSYPISLAYSCVHVYPQDCQSASSERKLE